MKSKTLEMLMQANGNEAGAQLRYQVYRLFDQWHGSVGGRSDHLAALLGYDGWRTMRDNFNERDGRVCHALLSGHGWAIYKSMLIRMKK